MWKWYMRVVESPTCGNAILEDYFVWPGSNNAQGISDQWGVLLEEGWEENDCQMFMAYIPSYGTNQQYGQAIIAST
jgi:hypothetical protein